MIDTLRNLCQTHQVLMGILMPLSLFIPGFICGFIGIKIQDIRERKRFKREHGGMSHEEFFKEYYQYIK